MFQTSVDDEVEILAENLLTEESDPVISVFRPNREGIRKVLGDLEAEVMEYIWEANSNQKITGVTVRDVYEAFRLRRTIAYTTVMSTMARLALKHLLITHKVDTAFIYSPSLSKEAFIDNFVSRILENLLVSFLDTTEAHLQRLTNQTDIRRVSTLKNRVAQLREGAMTNLPADNIDKQPNVTDSK